MVHVLLKQNDQRVCFNFFNGPAVGKKIYELLTFQDMLQAWKNNLRMYFLITEILKHEQKPPKVQGQFTLQTAFSTANIDL